MKPGGIDTSVKVTVDQAAVDRLTKSRTGPTGLLVDQAAAKALGKAQAAAPVETGTLRGSITKRSATDPSGDVTVEIVVTAPYWAYNEYGTRNMAPRPFMRQALT